MTEQITMTHDQIAGLIVKDVRRHAHCTNFKSVSVHKIADGQIPGANWSYGNNVDYGGDDQKVCEDALREIIPRMQREYRLKDR
jgi:hypothetical protein